MSSASIVPPVAPPMTDLRMMSRRPPLQLSLITQAFTTIETGTDNSIESHSTSEAGLAGSAVASTAENTNTEHPQSETHQSHEQGVAEGSRDVDPLDAVESQVSIYLMLHRDADTFLESLDADSYADAWPVNQYYTVMVHSYSSEDWNSLAQFIQIQRRDIRRRLRLVVDAPPTQSRAPPKSIKHHGASFKFCRKLLYVVGVIGVLALGGPMVWFITGRVSAFLSWVSEVLSLLALAYYSMLGAAETVAMNSIHTVMSSFTQLGRAGIALRTGMKHNIKRHFLATVQSALIYLEELSGQFWSRRRPRIETVKVPTLHSSSHCNCHVVVAPPSKSPSPPTILRLGLNLPPQQLLMLYRESLSTLHRNESGANSLSDQPQLHRITNSLLLASVQPTQVECNSFVPAAVPSYNFHGPLRPTRPSAGFLLLGWHFSNHYPTTVPAQGLRLFYLERSVLVRLSAVIKSIPISAFKASMVCSPDILPRDLPPPGIPGQRLQTQSQTRVLIILASLQSKATSGVKSDLWTSFTTSLPFPIPID
ncbi:hypothetical protein FA13DRAFT_1715484 [Coprinellus micaceus]|uniref:Uncharacterized protein n=1 Tax=Coprinellus micaceus TaxID=71717 RepID=A0A4Y7SMX4_COPMI|nr:hypothetical protein FA13DRAFT_1715484 [Coprinellus micaceus]